MMLETDGLLATGDAEEAERWLAERSPCAGAWNRWAAQHDRNFKVTAADGSRYLFKIHPPLPDPRAELQARCCITWS
jgi:Ser/Thr protein kinase RdoA (MazF antagonist)